MFERDGPGAVHYGFIAIQYADHYVSVSESPALGDDGSHLMKEFFFGEHRIFKNCRNFGIVGKGGFEQRQIRFLRRCYDSSQYLRHRFFFQGYGALGVGDYSTDHITKKKLVLKNRVGQHPPEVLVSGRSWPFLLGAVSSYVDGCIAGLCECSDEHAAEGAVVLQLPPHRRRLEAKNGNVFLLAHSRLKHQRRLRALRVGDLRLAVFPDLYDLPACRSLGIVVFPPSKEGPEFLGGLGRGRQSSRHSFLGYVLRQDGFVGGRRLLSEGQVHAEDGGDARERGCDHKRCDEKSCEHLRRSHGTSSFLTIRQFARIGEWPFALLGSLVFGVSPLNNSMELFSGQIGSL